MRINREAVVIWITGQILPVNAVAALVAIGNARVENGTDE